MFQCNNCNYKFDEPTKKNTTYESECGVSSLFMSSTPCEMEVCPKCGDYDFDELMQCDFCGKWVKEEDLTDTEGSVSETLTWACPKCTETYNIED